MNLKDNLINSLSGEEVEITPVVSVTQVGIVEAMHKTDAFWPDAHTNAAKMATLGSSLYELAGLECARIPFDWNGVALKIIQERIADFKDVRALCKESIGDLSCVSTAYNNANKIMAELEKLGFVRWNADKNIIEYFGEIK